MSKKATTIDMLGEAHLPADLLTPTLGSNYGLDGFPDMEYGMGVLEGFQPGDTAGLPEGMTAKEESDKLSALWLDESTVGMDLTESLKTATVQDLSWLEVQEQDPERLPVNPVDTVIPELEEAWGTESRTGGIHFHATTDLEEARYRASLEDDTPKYRFTQADLSRVVRKAMRRSTAGHNLKAIFTEAAEFLGDEAHRVRQAMALIKAEHGLAGKVFIRAAAYPGYDQGKWTKHLKKIATGAQYLVVDKRTLKGSTTIQGGYCTITKKRAVTSVPWKQALAHYRPLLEGAGRKVAGTDPREALRSAFLLTPKSDRLAHHLPHHIAPADRVSSGEAKQAFASAPQPERKVYDPAVERAAQERKAAWVKINAWVNTGRIPLDAAMGIVQADLTGRQMLHRAAALVVRSKGAAAFSGTEIDLRPPKATAEEARQALAAVQPPKVIQPPAPVDPRQQAAATLTRWVRAGLLLEGDAHRLMQSKAEPLIMLRAASQLVAVPKDTSHYAGQGVGLGVIRVEDSAEKIKAALDQAVKWNQQRQASIDQVVEERRRSAIHSGSVRKTAALQPAIDKIKAAIDKGVRGRPLRNLIVRTIPRDQTKFASQLLRPLLRRTGALEDTPKNTRTYEGRTYRPVAQKMAVVTPHTRETEILLRWAAQAMNEGWAGKEFDSLLSVKFSSAVRKNASERLRALRQIHEGGAGFVYVDASAYASDKGINGCKGGALKFRANQVKNVLAMDRCSGCSLVSVKSDGSRVCSQYNKQLVTASDFPEEMTAIRKANIKSANMDDQEATASMFASAYDPSEFDLHNASLEDIEFESAPDSTEFGEVLFGGMEF